ncbi:type II secretion system F family protein [Xanthobacter flavus]|uniref:type II secretion system F family protein n=1 Tax=Xanthobacter flavus TaxID=281 RepID=UPI0037297346
MTNGLLLPLLVAATVALAVLALFYGTFFGGAAADRRMRNVKAQAPVSIRGSGAEAERMRRALLASRLEEVARQERDRRRLPLKALLHQAGLTWTTKKFVLISIGVGVAAFLVVIIALGNPFLALAVGPAAGILGPRKYVQYMRAKRIRQFVKELPNAIDSIVRGTRAGLHVNECVRQICRDAQEPVRSEFRQVADAQMLGQTLAEAMERLSQRIPVEETRFLALALSIQASEGGGIAEALSGLSNTMRERIKLNDKIHAMSAEARSGAALLAALPLAGVAMNYATDAHKTALLWTTTTGQIALVANLAWLVIGFFVMKKMQDVKV